nr:glutaredoxin 3 [Tahibacter caeni]
MSPTETAAEFPGADVENSVARIEMYTTAICPYCVAAKNVLKAKGLDYSEIRIDSDPALRDEMLQRSGGRRTVPQIFINGQHVGGHDDLVAADRSGRLAQLLGSAA